MNITVKRSGFIPLTTRKDLRRGDLTVAEAIKDIPFPIRRVYVIHHTKQNSLARGSHAHKTLKQVFVCVNGSFVLGLDDGKRKQKILMNQPSLGIIIGPKLWHTMSKFSKDCVMISFASDHYRETDYIRSYDEFQAFVKKRT
ncbi:MAG: hypothetical protein RL681_822 [Candidatus Parcubacteria bacterium]|jgi:dTDP-4-dehydrorhamnose 3,5-epimerase-like enzyme